MGRIAARHSAKPPQRVRKTQRVRKLGVMLGFATLIFFFTWYASLLACAAYFGNYSAWVNSVLVQCLLAGGLLLVIIGCLSSLFSIVVGGLPSHQQHARK